MKLVTALFCFAIITCVEMPDGVGQSLSQSHYDSLASQLSALKGSDRIDAFIELAMMISNDSVKLIPKDSAEIYLLMARSEAMRSVDSLTKARVYLHLGIITYRKLTFRKEALAYLDTALTYLPERGDRSVYADIIYYKALVYQDSQNHEHAMELYLEILPIYLRTNNYMQQGLTYNKIALLHTYKADNKNGVVYFLKAVERFDAGHIIHIYAAHNLASCGRAYYRMGDDANALQKFFEAVAMFESLKDDPGQSYMLQSIGQVYFRQKKYEDALNYHFKALALSKTSNHKQAWGEALCNIAETYWKQGNNQKSIEYINQALNLDLKHNSFGLPRDYRLLGDIYFGLKQYDRSLWYYQQSLHFSDSVRLNRLSAIAHVSIGKVYRVQGQLEKGKLQILKGLSLIDRYGEKEIAIDAYDHLTKVYEAMGDYKSAFQSHVLFMTVRDSLFNEAKSKEITGMLMTHEIGLREKENQLLKRENELNQEMIASERNQKFLLNSLILCLSIVAIVISVGFYQKQKANKKLVKQFQIISAQSQEIGLKNDSLQKALEDLKIAQSQLIQSEKMASLGMLTAGIAHEINNPVNYIFGGVQALESNIAELRKEFDNRGKSSSTPVFADIESLMAAIRNGVNRTVGIVSGLKSFVSPDDKKYHYVDLRECIESTLTIINSKLKHAIKVIKHFGDLPLVLANVGQISQVLLNIIDNSVYAIGEKNQAGIIEIATSTDNGFAVISIKDNGGGIPEDITSNIFNPFFTTKEIGKGTGLGLFISYDIIKEHGGKIALINDYGIGAEFKIYLPLNGPPA